MTLLIRRAGWLPLAAALAALAGGCNMPAGKVEQSRDEFRQSRKEAELSAKVATLEAKLEETRLAQVQDQNRADRLGADLTAERNARRQEKIQHDLAINLNFELKQQLAKYQEQQKVDEPAMTALKNTLLQMRQTVDQQDQELAKLRQQVSQLQEELATLRRQAQR